MNPQQMFQTVQPQQPDEQAGVSPRPATPPSPFQTAQPTKPAGVSGPPKSLAVPEYRINPQGINQGVVNRDGASIPNDPANRDWQRYLSWDKTNNAAPMPGTAGGTAGPVKDWSFLDDPKYKGLPGLDAYRNMAAGKSQGIYDGQQFGNLADRFQNFARNSDPAKVKAHLDELIANKQQDELFNKAFHQDQNGHFIPNNSKIKYGTPGPGGAKFGQNTFFSQDYSKQVSKVPGSGVYSLGIDPSDPNANAYAAAFIRAKENSSTGPGTAWSKILGDGKWGRFDAKVPGLKALKAQFPKATDLQLLDAVVRMAHSQAALEPVDDTMKILGPLIVAAGVFLAPMAVGALGGTVGAGAGATMSMGTAQALGGALGGTISSGIQSDWDPTATIMGMAGGAATGGFNPFASTMAAGVSPTNLAINTAIAETANINPDLATALSFAKVGVGGLKTGNFAPLARKGAGYLFGKTVPGLPGKVGEYAINNLRSAPQQQEDDKDKVRR
jgi:hypothetical protein